MLKTHRDEPRHRQPITESSDFDRSLICIVQGCRWFETILQEWTSDDMPRGASEYALLAERVISQTLLRQTSKPSVDSNSELKPGFEDTGHGFLGLMGLPRHFLGALCASAQGLGVSKSCRVLETAAGNILHSRASPLERRAAAWSLGHVAACGGAAAEYVLEIGGLHNLERAVRGGTGHSGLKGTFMQALNLAAASPEVRSWLGGRKWVTQTGDCFEVEKSHQAVYNNLFNAPKPDADEVWTTGKGRWETDSSTESLGGFMKEPIPDAQTEAAFYDQLFGISTSKEIHAISADAASTQKMAPLDGSNKTEAQCSVAEENGTSAKTVWERAGEACICLPTIPGVLFESPSDGAQKCASKYRGRLQRCRAEREMNGLHTESLCGKGVQSVEMTEGEDATNFVGSGEEATKLPLKAEGAKLREDGLTEGSVTAEKTQNEVYIHEREGRGLSSSPRAELGTDGESGRKDAGTEWKRRERSERNGTASRSAAEEKALAMLNGLCNPVTAVSD
jgi:hypothetical protein